MSLDAYSSPVIQSSFPSDGVLLLLLNRKPVNALNNLMWSEIGRLFDVASEDPQVRCVVFGSALDRAFSAGLDLQSVFLRVLCAGVGRVADCVVLRSDAQLDVGGADPARTALLLKAQ